MAACDGQVVRECLPVPCFGDISSKSIEVATIGLNPARSEYYSETGYSLPRALRLPTLDDYGKVSREELTDRDLTDALTVAGVAHSTFFLRAVAKAPSQSPRSLRVIEAVARGYAAKGTGEGLADLVATLPKADPGVAERVVVGWVFLHWCEAQYARQRAKLSWK